MDTHSANPKSHARIVVRTIVVLTIVVALTVTAAWSILIGYGAWALFNVIAG
jgi:hypothetical protein